jgi:hypothetical protein
MLAVPLLHQLIHQPMCLIKELRPVIKASLRSR